MLGDTGRGESILLDFFYAQPVGHAIEALHHALALHRADPRREISVLLNAATPTELAGCCSFIEATYPVAAPFLEPAPYAAQSLDAVPRCWDWVLDDPRRHQDFQLEMFPGMRDHYAASVRRFEARLGRRPLGYPPPTRLRHQQLRLELPAGARRAAIDLVPQPRGPLIALMPTGSSARAHYPSLASWEAILDALAAALPSAEVVLVGRLERDVRTSSVLSRSELARLLEHRAVTGEAFDRPLLEQLAVVERCGLFLSPHTGFGMAALAVATPWLTLSGGRWFEWYFNQVPFRSVVPDTNRYPAYSQFAADVPEPDGQDGDRIPSMTRRRIHEDLPRIVRAAQELLAKSVPYGDCLTDYFTDLVAAHHGDAAHLWSFDDVHRDYLPATA